MSHWLMVASKLVQCLDQVVSSYLMRISAWCVIPGTLRDSTIMKAVVNARLVVKERVGWRRYCIRSRAVMVLWKILIYCGTFNEK
ncbi:hypothetical protein D3C72_1236470 [compost metagenome]